jgi:hypothetical protein
VKNASRRSDTLWPGGPQPDGERARLSPRALKERTQERAETLKRNVRRRQAIVIALTVAVIGGGMTFAFAAENEPNAADANAAASATPEPTGSPVPEAVAEAMKIPNDQGMDPRCQGSRTPRWCHENRGPLPADFVNIRDVTRAAPAPARGPDASTGTFVAVCGRNQNGHHNPDNFIVAPGTSNGAHHTHDYVGNLTTDGNSTNESLAAGGTTCRRGDLSPYYWPVIRRTGTVGDDAEAPGGGLDKNVGQIIEPVSVQLQFRGNAQAKVVAMPRFIRVITGDAKATTNGPANARANWTCSGTNRFTTKYPICPRGTLAQRVLIFPSCWDGVNTDSANHRAHILFTQADGSCPTGTQPVPQLRMTLTYNLGRTPNFALDSFPEQLHNPLTDHGDFVNVMPDPLMARVVDCINSGRRC